MQPPLVARLLVLAVSGISAAVVRCFYLMSFHAVIPQAQRWRCGNCFNGVFLIDRE